MPSTALESLPLCHSHAISEGSQTTFILYMGNQGLANEYVTSAWRPELFMRYGRRVENRSLFLKQLVIYLQKNVTHEMSEAYVCLKYFYGSCLKIDSSWLPAVVALASLVNVHCKHGSSKGQLRKHERVMSGRASSSTALGTLSKRHGNSGEDKARAVTGGYKKTASV